MAQITAGKVRLAVRDQAGRLLSFSEAVDATIADNTGQPRLYLARSRQDMVAVRQGGDHPILIPFVVYGTSGQVLALQYHNPAGSTSQATDTSDFVFDVTVIEATRTPNGQVQKDFKQLAIGQRITPTGANSTRAHPLGVTDDRTLDVTADFIDMARFAPGERANWAPDGFARLEVHDGA